MKSIRKTTAVILSCILLLGVVLSPAAYAAKIPREAEASSGVTGDCTWELSDDGVLTVSGSGAMADYDWSSPSPWGTYVRRVVIQKGVTYISNTAFSYCTALESVSIPDTVESIGVKAFYFCTNLKSLAIPKSVTGFGRQAMEYISALTSLSVDPDNPVFDSRNNCNAIIETASDTLLRGCRNTVIPGDIRYIGTGAFSGCTAMTSIALPEGLIRIGTRAFDECSDMTELKLPHTLTTLNEMAFAYCNALTSVVIPDSVTEIRSRVFVDCPNLTSLSVEKDNPVYDSRGNCNAVIETASDTLILSCPGTVIPDSIKNLGRLSFADQSNLTAITLPDSLQSIGEFAFENCTALTSIEIPFRVKSIGSDAFFSCESLTSVTIPFSVKQIGSNIFESGFTQTPRPPEIYYLGSEAEWKAIRISYSNDTLFRANIHFAEVVPAAKVEIIKKQLSLYAGDTVFLSASIAPENITDPTITWSSSDTKIAVVDKYGFVTGKAAGTAIITAASGDKRSTCTVTVKQPIIYVSEVKLNKTEMTLAIGDKAALKATVKPANAVNKAVTWSSSNKKVAVADSKGNITAKAVGKAIIYANAGWYRAGCTVTVVRPPVSKVTLDKTKLTLDVGKQAALKATVSPATAKNKSVKWTTSNKKIAAVDAKGNVTAKAAGKATITAASHNGKKASCTVTVRHPVTKITLSKSKLTLDVGKKAALKATVSPSNATDKTVKWSTSNQKVATVDSKGNVTAKAAGKATITAASHNGKKAGCTVTVRQPVTKISLNKTQAALAKGKTLTLKATVSPSNATDKTVKWTTSDKKIAAVDSKGKVKALKKGTATVTATSGNGKKATCKITVK